MAKNSFIIWSFSILITALAGCTVDDDYIEPSETVQPSHELSLGEEINQWIFSEMNHNYLWREDIPDSLDCDFKLTPVEFYNSLLSPKDRFSYVDNKSTSRSVSDYSLGFAYQDYVSESGKTYKGVLYVNSEEARKAGLKRGDFIEINSISGGEINLVRIECQENGKILKTPICFRYPTTRAAVNNTVQLDSIYDIGGRKLGYLCYLRFEEPKDFYESFKKFEKAQIDGLILDLRYNPGGYATTCKKLCNLIVDESGYGQMFQQLSYNDLIAKENFEKYGDERTFEYFDFPKEDSEVTMGNVYSYLNLNHIAVIVSGHTASASEALINSLKVYMRVDIIGETTVGKGVGMKGISHAKYPYLLQPITFRYYNAQGETVDDSGIKPDYYIAETYNTPKKDLGDLSEPLLAKAMEVMGGVNQEIESDGAKCSLVDALGLRPIGAPSFVTEYKTTHYEESH